MNIKFEPNPGEANENHKSYQEYNKSLRTWFVAFGIGGPVFLLSQDAVLQKLRAAGVLPSVSLFFLIGVATQVFIAFINKIECWYCYYAHVDMAFTKTRRGRFMLWLDNQFWLDIICDLISIILFSLAIIEVFNVYI